MKKILTALCLIMAFSVFFCGCGGNRNSNERDDIVPDVSSAPESQHPSHNIDLPDGNGNDDDIDILPDVDGGILDGDNNGTNNDNGTDNNNGNGTVVPTDSPTNSPAVSPAVSPAA